MENFRIEDANFDQSEVSVGKTVKGLIVYLDFDPDGYGDGQTIMQYTPNQARKLAAALIMAAEDAGKE